MDVQEETQFALESTNYPQVTEVRIWRNTNKLNNNHLRERQLSKSGHGSGYICDGFGFGWGFCDCLVAEFCNGLALDQGHDGCIFQRTSSREINATSAAFKAACFPWTSKHYLKPHLAHMSEDDEMGSELKNKRRQGLDLCSKVIWRQQSQSRFVSWSALPEDL